MRISDWSSDVCSSDLTRKAYMAGAWRDTPVYDRAALRPGEMLKGPVIVTEPTSTIVVEPGWQARLTARRALVLKRLEALPVRKASGTEVAPVMLEIFNNLLDWTSVRWGKSGTVRLKL